MSYSVIIPVYNAMPHMDSLKRNIISFLATPCNVEVIIVDDGSIDGCSTILENISDIIYIKQNNQGVSAARNAGIKLASNDYLIFFDSDDELDASLFNFLESLNTKNDVIFFNYQINNAIVNHLFEDKDFKGHDIFKLFLDKKINLTICCLVVKKDFIVLNDIFFDINYPLGEDIVFLFKVLYFSNHLNYFSNSYFNYILKSGGAAKSYVDYRKSRMLELFLSFKDDYTLYEDLLESYDFYMLTLYLYLLKNSFIYGVKDKQSAKFIMDFSFLLKIKNNYTNLYYTFFKYFFRLFYVFSYYFILYFRKIN